MTLGNMRELGVRSLDVSCWLCRHQAVLTADRWPDDIAIPTFAPHMVCTSRRIVGADARSNWKEQPPTRADCPLRRFELQSHPFGVSPHGNTGLGRMSEGQVKFRGQKNRIRQ